MAAIHGKDGSVSDATGTIALLDDWSLDVGMDPAEVTDFGDSWRAYIAGLRGATGRASGNWDMTDASQARLQTAMLAGTSIIPKLYTNSSNYYTLAAAFITSMRVGTPADGKVTVEFSFQCSGAVTYT